MFNISKPWLRRMKVLRHIFAISSVLMLGLILLRLHDRIREDGGITPDVEDLMKEERWVTIVALSLAGAVFLMDVWILHNDFYHEDVRAGKKNRGFI